MTEKNRVVLKGKMKIEHLQKRFGVIAVEKRFATADQVIDALRIQIAEDISTGKHRLIGRIFYEQNLITLSQLNEVLTAMEKAQENDEKCTEKDKHG
jgi:hypothetical protein